MNKQSRLEELKNEFYKYVENNIDDAFTRSDLWDFMDIFDDIASE